MRGLARLIERIAPWLVDVGTWIFGGLMALNLVVIAALLTVGPVDVAVNVAVAAFGCALPIEVAGMILLRLSKDVDDIRLEALTQRSFEEARFPNIGAYFPSPRQRGAVRRRRTRVTLAYALALATVSVALSMVGMVASLWHMAPWVAEASIAASALSALLVLLVGVHAMPPESAAEKRMNQ